MARTLPLLALALLAGLTPAVMATDYYVATGGDETAAGSIDAPWGSIPDAVTRLSPGDRLFIRGGLYELAEQVRISLVGREDAWITIAGYPGEEAILDGERIDEPATGNDQNRFTVILLKDAAYVRVENLTVRNSWGSGIRSWQYYVPMPSEAIRTDLDASTWQPGGSRHIDIVECRIDNTYAPGIGFWHCEHIRVLGNEVTAANNLGLYRGSGDPPREAAHEAISIAATSHFEVAGNHIHHCHKEGIDVKETSRHGVVHHNYIHDLPRQGLYADAWFGLLGNIEFHHNLVHDCEWGIAFSTEGSQGSEAGFVDVRAHHNIFHDNRGSGVFFSVWGKDGPRRGVALYNNTIVRNGRANHWAGATGGIDVRSRNVHDLVIVNNLCADNGAYEIATRFDPANEAELMADRGVRVSHNLVSSDHDSTEGRAGLYGEPFVYIGEAVAMGDPGFVAGDAGNFHLAPGSPAIGAGMTAIDLPGIHPDLGAIPFGHGIEEPFRPKIRTTGATGPRVELPTFPGWTYRCQSSPDLADWTTEETFSGDFLPHRFRLDMAGWDRLFLRFLAEPVR